ncbi:hypothetical protein [Lachnoclostridium phytofermentans]|uniref:DUF3221 domain-containing protein n=1 Tax=Lachnoclostridium phytofermentans (strain ATCC 700394 / DSM 18823 / ISDg) TaxID=357809 RepID=A9KQD7_LACP7|nr:hypothetical protein [Lachnoclostridium phytofermentans]ABX40446.1 hypothetical protein Cphy_0056 [Lachnoclostridium phytofermentans ISDg]
MIKKQIVYTIIFLVVLFTSGCEKKQDYLNGTVSEVFDTYIIVTPKDDELLKEKAEKIVVTKTIALATGFPDLDVGDEIRVVYSGIKKEDDLMILDSVFAVYKSNELKY